MVLPLLWVIGTFDCSSAASVLVEGWLACRRLSTARGAQGMASATAEAALALRLAGGRGLAPTAMRRLGLGRRRGPTGRCRSGTCPPGRGGPGPGRPSSWLLEAICSVPAAACSVTWAMPWVALETSSELAACWTVAVAISAILAAVAFTLSTIFFSASPVSLLSLRALLRPAASIP